MAQIFLFTGENMHEMHEERRRWVREFSQKHGMENLLTVDAKGLSCPALMDEVCIAPFIAQKRLVIVSGIPKFEKGQMTALENAIHPQVLLLFIESKPDKRLSATKELLKIATVKTFTPLRGSMLLSWLCNEAKEDGATLSQSDAQKLVAMVGEDQALLSNEVRKLSLYAEDRPISQEDIELMVVLSTEQAVWQLLDLLAAKKRDKALQFTKKLLRRGESPYGLWNMFLWIVSQISLVVSQVLEGNTSPQLIATACGIHPNTARNILSLAQTYDAKKLLDLVTLITETDKDLKTGGFKATNDSTEELQAILDTRIAAVV